MVIGEGEGHPVEDCGLLEPPLVPGEPRESGNLFLRDTAARSFQLVNVTPSGVGSLDPKLDVVSADGSHVVFQSRSQLTSEAPVGGESGGTTGGHCTSEFGNSFVWSAGTVRLLTVLPDGTPVRGSLAGAHPFRCGVIAPQTAGFTHSVSSNGERVLFYAGGGFKQPLEGSSKEVRPNAPYIDGGLYLRQHPSAEQSALNGSGECTEPEKACTVQIDIPEAGASSSPGGGQFQWANAETTRIFFTDEQKLTADSTAEAGKPDLFEYDLEKPQVERLTDLTANAAEPADVLGVSGASEDGSYLYFVAQAALTGSQPNSHGATALPAQGTATLTGPIAKATGTLENYSPSVTNVSVSNGEFHKGQELVGEYVPLGTTVTSCSPSCSAPTELTLSNWIVVGGSFRPTIELTGLGSTEVTGLSTTSGEFREGMTISGEGVPPHTWIKEVGPGTLTLSRGVAVNGTKVLSAVGANLYLRHAGITTFIAPLNAIGGDQCDWTASCLTARVSPNGEFLAFDSLDSLTGYDNRPFHSEACRHLTKTPESPCMEAYRYAAASGEHGELTCASCHSDGSPPAAELGAWSVIQQPSTAYLAWAGTQHLDHPVSNAGQVFFDTMEELVPTDKNKTWDVYEYSGGEGESAQLHLISSGQSELPSYYEGASADGSNVFFVTFQSLLRADTRTDYDLYDARADGGFPEPLEKTCEGIEECHPEYRGGSSLPPGHYEGPGNLPKCKRGFVLRQRRCVKTRKHKRRHRKRAHHRAARLSGRVGK